MSKDKVPYSKVSKGSIPSNSVSGKGDCPRPVNAQTYTDNYDGIKWD